MNLNQAGVGQQSIVAEGASLTGRVTGQDVCFLGEFSGEAAARRLRVGTSALVRADLQCDEVEILGRFEGRIDAKILRFRPTAKARGVFHSEILTIDEDAQVDGTFGRLEVSSGPATSTSHLPVPEAPTLAVVAE